MKAVPTSFESVSQVKRYNDWIDGPSTSFRFAPTGRQERVVTVRGSPSLRDGMCVVAVLRDKDDWSSLVGWKDVETGSIVAKSPEVALKAVALRLLVLGAVILAWALGVHYSVLVFVFGICLLALWQGLREWRQSREAWQRLANVGASGEA